MHQAIGLMSKVFTNGPRDRVSIIARVIPKTFKMLPDTALLDTQHYKVRIKSKVAPFPTSGPSGIRVGWGIETNGSFEAERPPTSAGPPSGERAAFLSPMHPLYSTRPHSLVQAIFWHTCPDLDLGP